MRRVARFRKTSQLKKWPVSEVMACAFLTSVIDYTVVYLRGSSNLLLSGVPQSPSPRMPRATMSHMMLAMSHMMLACPLPMESLKASKSA